MTVIWIWLGINVGFVLGAWWASRPVVREGEASISPSSSSSSRTHYRRIP